MIKFLFCGNINSNDKFSISIDGATNIISSECRAIEFELPEKKICEIRIEKQLSKSEITWKNITLDLLTIVLRGMAVLLFMDVDSEWFRNVQPYSIIERVEEGFQQVGVPGASLAVGDLVRAEIPEPLGGVHG